MTALRVLLIINIIAIIILTIILFKLPSTEKVIVGMSGNSEPSWSKTTNDNDIVWTKITAGWYGKPEEVKL